MGLHRDERVNTPGRTPFLGLPSALPKRSERSTEEEEEAEEWGPMMRRESRMGAKAGRDTWTKGEQSHSVALREKDSLGLDLPLPRMIFCSSFCCF